MVRFTSSSVRCAPYRLSIWRNEIMSISCLCSPLPQCGFACHAHSLAKKPGCFHQLSCKSWLTPGLHRHFAARADHWGKVSLRRLPPVRAAGGLWPHKKPCCIRDATGRSICHCKPGSFAAQPSFLSFKGFHPAEGHSAACTSCHPRRCAGRCCGRGAAFHPPLPPRRPGTAAKAALAAPPAPRA